MSFKYATLVLSEDSIKKLKKCVVDANDLQQVNQALETFRLEREVEAIPSALTPEGDSIKEVMESLRGNR